MKYVPILYIFEIAHICERTTTQNIVLSNMPLYAQAISNKPNVSVLEYIKQENSQNNEHHICSNFSIFTFVKFTETSTHWRTNRRTHSGPQIKTPSQPKNLSFPPIHVHTLLVIITVRTHALDM